MKIGIISRFNHQEALDLAEKIINHISSESVLAPNLADELGGEGVPIEEMKADGLVTVGGDGTVLYALQKLPEVPVLGINMGERGFLADVNPNKALEVVERLDEGELEVVEKERLEVDVSGEHLANALNEGVIRSSEPSRVLSFRVMIDGNEVERNQGDGMIVATPTGSTAYAMSAGGPVIDPRTEACAAVPLSTHRPKAMPLVYPLHSELEIELLDFDREADVTVDGQVTEKARAGDIVRFNKSESAARFFKWKEKFYRKVKEKL